MLNPLQAPLSVRGVFHQEYVELHAKVAQLQGQGRVLVIRGDGGEAEVSADKRIPMVDIIDNVIHEIITESVGFVRPIAEDLSVDTVAQRLLAVLNGQYDSENYGKITVDRTLYAIINCTKQYYSK
jgi:anthranilate phosphoribosyltransferase